MKAITVFTPTFNRAYCLPQLYESLVAQSSGDFVWLVIDDGSTDATRELVAQWMSDGAVDIRYVYQENQGMHGGHNTAYAHIDTELNVCIDSDDFMPPDAIEKILGMWQKHGPAHAGIIGLDAFKDGTIVGSRIPDGLHEATLDDLYRKHSVTGDKKLVLRTDIVRQFPPYPLYEGERFVPLGTLYLMIAQRYKCLCTNDVYCIVEYLPDGSSRNIFSQYRRHPRGFGYSRLVEMRYSTNFVYTFTRAMHLVSSAIFARRFDIFKDNPNKLATLAAIPFGLALHVYILIKNR
jgi:glycosyltransferase involved in cell wall biosynthesis